MWQPAAGSGMFVDEDQTMPKMLATDDIQLSFPSHRRSLSPEVEVGRISPSYARQELAKKLLNRRSLNELREQNVTSGLHPMVHDSRARLQRAQTTDLLERKIKSRPPQENLVNSNILRSGSLSNKFDIDPSLISRQQDLLKAQIGDEIKHHLQTRPGPLELVQNNIMQLDEPLNKVIKSGAVTFKANNVTPDNMWDSFDSLQPSPENALSPESVTSEPDVLHDDIPQGLYVSKPSHTKAVSLHGTRSSPKIKRKNQKPRVRKFKYHEYKPPNAGSGGGGSGAGSSGASGGGSSSSSGKNKTGEKSPGSPHSIRIKQQQLLLQLQVIKKYYPNEILPQTLDVLNEIKHLSKDVSAPTAGSLADLKVSELKEELKKRNLHTYGNKQQLLERLRPYIDTGPLDATMKDTTTPATEHRSSSDGDIADITPMNLRKTSETFSPSFTGTESFTQILSNPDTPPEMPHQMNPSPQGPPLPSSQQGMSSNQQGLPSNQQFMASVPQQVVGNMASWGSGNQGHQLHVLPNNIAQPAYDSARAHVTPDNQGYSQGARRPEPVQIPAPAMPIHSAQNIGLPNQNVVVSSHQSFEPKMTAGHNAPGFHGNAVAPAFPQSSGSVPIPAGFFTQPNIRPQQTYTGYQMPVQFGNTPTAPKMATDVTRHQFCTTPNNIAPYQHSGQPATMTYSGLSSTFPNQAYPTPLQQQQHHQSRPGHINLHHGGQMTQQPPAHITRPAVSQMSHQQHQQHYNQSVPLQSDLSQLRGTQQPRGNQKKNHQDRLNDHYFNTNHTSASTNVPGSLPLKQSAMTSQEKLITTPDVINIILGTPNTTPMLKEGDTVASILTPYKSQPPPQPMDFQDSGHVGQFSTDEWLAANLPQEIKTPDTGDVSRLTTPGGNPVFEFDDIYSAR